MKWFPVVKAIAPAFTDARGAITDLLNRPVEHVGLITTEKGAVRASHFHRKSFQYSYILCGKFEVLAASSAAPAQVKRYEIKAGDLISIPPGTIHRFRALSRADMVDMISLSRAGNAFESDVVRVDFVEGAFVLPPKKAAKRPGKS